MLGYITWDVSPYLIGGTPDAAINVRWYSLMFAIGFIVGYNMVARMFKHEGAPEKWLGTLLLWLVGGTMVGARLGHVFFYEWDHYSAHPMEIFKIWEGGLASHGGAIGVIIAVCLFSYFSTKRSPLWTLDRIAAPVALVSCLIRIGKLSVCLFKISRIGDEHFNRFVYLTGIITAYHTRKFTFELGNAVHKAPSLPPVQGRNSSY